MAGLVYDLDTVINLGIKLYGRFSLPVLNGFIAFLSFANGEGRFQSLPMLPRGFPEESQFLFEGPYCQAGTMLGQT